MPNIEDKFLDSSIYLYKTFSDAKEGKGGGGTGFLVSLPSRHCGRHLYAVTNRHVIRHCRIIRLNTKDHQTEEIPTKATEWVSHSSHDLAVRYICSRESGKIGQFEAVPLADFLTKNLIELHGIGAGEDLGNGSISISQQIGPSNAVAPQPQKGMD